MDATNPSAVTEERKQFASDLQLMKHRAMNLGLYATGQRLDCPIRMVGFEIAGDVQSCIDYENDLEAAKP
jgi:hypothetical protein